MPPSKFVKKKKEVVDPDVKARKSLAAMEEISRKIKETLGTKELHDRVMALPDDKRRAVFEKLKRLKELQTRDKCRLFFKEFVDEMWPGNIPGPHFEELEKIFHRVDAGEPVRAIVCLPPRFGKSERLSYLFPAWYIGKHPEKHIIQASNVKSLAEDFGGKIRNLVDSEEYKRVFPGVSLAADSSAKGRWNTNKGGRYFAVGAGGTVVGRGANLCVHPDSTVVSIRGSIKASEVVLGDMLLGYGENGWEFGPVSKIIWSESDTEVLINGKVRCTPNHPIWVKGKGWVEAADVKVGDYVRRCGFNLRVYRLACKTLEWLITLASTISGR